MRTPIYTNNQEAAGSSFFAFGGKALAVMAGILAFCAIGNYFLL